MLIRMTGGIRWVTRCYLQYKTSYSDGGIAGILKHQQYFINRIASTFVKVASNCLRSTLVPVSTSCRTGAACLKPSLQHEPWRACYAAGRTLAVTTNQVESVGESQAILAIVFLIEGLYFYPS